ncbi:MAG: calcium/sodium antiporter [Clostridia bacterium]|nr:calcium/sodium antiporter [Clostridia bacterium]
MADAVLLFAFGFILLIKGGDWFVDGATAIAKKFHIPDILIGATVVSIGTTLPEVMVSATGALNGSGAMAYGNAIGSIICNTALIAAITIAVKPAEVDRKTLIIPVCFFFGAAIFYSCITYFVGKFQLWVGILLLVTFVIYMAVTIWQALKSAKQERQLLTSEQTDEEEKDSSLLKSLIFLVLGAFVIAIGADILVDKGTFIATKWGVPETVISLTFVALGTSLPELVTAITSLLKGRGALSLGNLIGANLFNLVLVSGMAITIAPFAVPVGKLIGGINASLIIDIPVMLAVMAILTIPAIIRNKLSKTQGYSLLAIYAAFVVLQFVL